MATKAKIAQNNKRKRLAKRNWDLRQELKQVISDPNRTEEEREGAMVRLQKMPRNSSATRVRNRCAVTGRPRAFYRKFGLSRIALRELALEGYLPGIIKASW